MSTFRIVQELLQPYFYFTIGGTDDLTDAVVTCTMLDINDAAIIDASSVGCSITDIPTRQGEYKWQTGNTDLRGRFNLYFTITPFGLPAFNTERFPVQIVSNVSDELITIADVERQIRFDLTDQSEQVYALIQAVREQCESVTRRALKPTSKTLTLDCFPSYRGIIEIPNAPLRFVESITYLDFDNVEQTIDPSLYRVVLKNQVPEQPSRVMPIYGTEWPTALNDTDTISINYKCGYGTVLNLSLVYETIELPKAIKQWMLINIANLYDNPETIQIGNANRLSLIEIPTIADSLIANYKIAKW